jgi:predicted enzyme related to lactoylglutathione lyase
MLHGMTTVTYLADDVAAARDWYTDVTEVDPYFERADDDGVLAYVEFRLGFFQHELGIMHSRYASPRPDDPAGAVLYWAVDDAAAEYERLLSLGATEHLAPLERGPGYVTASVVDPFGNILGVMKNANFEAMVTELNY